MDDSEQNTALPLITRIEDLPPALSASLSDEEREWIEKIRASGFHNKGSFPLSVTPHFASLAGPEKSCPIRRQFMPDPLEAHNDPFALDDPLGEERFRITPRLVHQYRDRVLLLAGGNCAGFCRYCFRRSRMGPIAAFIRTEELEPVLSYLKPREEVKEILVSGGDPLGAKNSEIEELLKKLRGARPDISIRLCSRIPITNPERLDPDTITLLSRYQPIRIVTHINHVKELAPAARTALAGAVEAGIPVLVQTVLLRGINDDAGILAALFRECRNIGLSPYYLFQLDLAPGAAHFRVPLKEGLRIYGELKQLINDENNPVNCLPVYAVDLPGGGGKITLHEGVIAGEENRPGGKVFLLKDNPGKLWEYPCE